MKHKFFIICICAAFLLCAQNVFAITYDESLDGDSNLSGTDIGTLDLGLNTISGSIFFDNIGFSSRFDLDGYRFTVGTGMRLDSFIFDFNNFDYNDANLPPSESGSMTWRMVFSNGTSFNSTFINLFGTSPVELFQGLPENGPGLYLLRTDSINVRGGDAWSSDYTFNITTSAIPEPSTILLFGVGLLGLAGIGREKI